MTDWRTSGLTRVLVAALLAIAGSAAFLPTRLHAAQRLEVDPGLRHVEALLAGGQYAAAETEARRIVDAVPADESSADLAAIDLLVEALIRNGRGAAPDSRKLAEQAIEWRRQRYGREQPALATSLRRLGDVLLQGGSYESAAERFQAAVALRERAAAGDAGSLADDLDHLSRALVEAERYDEAMVLVGRALTLRVTASTGRGVGSAQTLTVRGLVWQGKGDYSRARADLLQALAIHEGAHPLHPETAAALVAYGEQLTLEGAAAEARPILDRAVSITERTLRPDHPDLALAMRTLASSLVDLGELDAARRLRERALSIAEAAFGTGHPLVAVQLNDLANVLLLQGDYAAGRPLYERALRIYQDSAGPDSSGAVTAVYNLALLDSRLGDISEARRQFQRAIKTWTLTLGPRHPNVGRALSALAEMLADEGFDAEARRQYERALAIREVALGPDHPSVARTLSGLAASLSRLGLQARALSLSQRAVATWEAAGGREGLAEALVVHGEILGRQENYPAARDAYQRALAIRRPLLGGSHPRVAEAQVALAVVEARLQNEREALDDSLDGERIGREHLRLTLGYLPERQALDYASKRARGLDLALSLSLSTDNPIDPRAFEAVILGRSLILDEMASRRRAMQGPPDTPARAEWTALAAARQRLANLVIRGPDEAHPQRYVALVDEARREKDAAERSVAERSAAFRSALASARTGLAQVQAQLEPGSALVSFVRYERSIFRAPVAAADQRRAAGASLRIVPSYLAFVLRPGHPDPILVPLGRADSLDALVAGWRRAMLADLAAAPDGSAVTPSFRVVGTTLRRRIWDPVATYLDGIDRVFVVPDGALNLVPLTALPTGRGRFLLEDGPMIHYLSAERDLVVAPVAHESTGLLAIGGPAFTDRVSVAAAAEGPPEATFRGASSRCQSFQSLRFNPLPGSGREAESVAETWRRLGLPTGTNTDTQVLLGSEATERAFKLLSPGKRILHVATHGFFLGDECTDGVEGSRGVGRLTSIGGPKPSSVAAAPPRRMMARPENPLLQSGLAMAGANRRAAAGPDEEDGILTAEEVAALDLEGVEWAVLSACDTGLGHVQSGEGVFGLRRAFQIAGARTVIMSLWSVDDRATQAWMQALYRARVEQHLDTAASVRQASLDLVRDRRARGQSVHPFYWAGFVAAGDWH